MKGEMIDHSLNGHLVRSFICIYVICSSERTRFRKYHSYLLEGDDEPFELFLDIRMMESDQESFSVGASCSCASNGCRGGFLPSHL